MSEEVTRIACLEPSDMYDYTQKFGDIIDDRVDEPIEMDGHEPHHGELPDNYDYDGILVSGSGAHVYEEDQWEQELEQYLDGALDQDIPVLGVCFGHQVAANVLGGTVEALADTAALPDDAYGSDDELLQDREMGYHTVSLTAGGRDSDLFDGMDEEFVAFASHLDYVADLPDDSTVLAENAYGIQAFKSTEHPAYGVQFHPEYDLDMAEALLENKELDDDAYETIAATLTEQNAAAAMESRTVFENFVEQL